MCASRHPGKLTLTSGSRVGTARTIASRGEARAPLASLASSLTAPSLDGECLSVSSASITSRLRYESVKRGCPTKLGSVDASTRESRPKTSQKDGYFSIPTFPVKAQQRKRSPCLSKVYVKHLNTKDRVEEEYKQLPPQLPCAEAMDKISHFACETQKMLSAIPADTRLDHCQKSRLKHKHMGLKRLQRHFLQVLRLDYLTSLHPIVCIYIGNISFTDNPNGMPRSPCTREAHSPRTIVYMVGQLDDCFGIWLHRYGILL